MCADTQKLRLTPGILVTTLLALFSASCSRDSRQADIKQCIAKVQQDASRGGLSDLDPSDDSETRHDKLGAVVAECMNEAGYRHQTFDMSDERCVDDVDFNPYCYRRSR
jgi:hypothetical protein